MDAPAAALEINPLLADAQAAKARNLQARALALLDQCLAGTPGDAVAQRMRQTLHDRPDTPFTYTRIMDFLIRKGLGFHDQFVVLENLIRKYDLRVGVELGVLYGYHAQHLVEACPDLFLYGVDAFRKLRPGNGYDDVSQQWFDELCVKTRSYLEPTGRWQLIRQTTLDAARSFTRLVDFVFIDADHGYEAVRDDIEAWWPHVRPGGIVSGHDFGQPEWPGVRRAVEECLASRGLEPTVDYGYVWWVKKPRLSWFGHPALAAQSP
jgi:hypothetical protein